MRSFIPLLITIQLAAAVSGCLRSPKGASATAEAASLTLSGQVNAPDGSPRQGVNVYVEDAPTPAGVTDATGAFTVLLSNDDLTRLAGAAPVGAGSFALYFEDTYAPLRGRSEPINLGERGLRTLSPAVVDLAATVSGKVLSLAGGRQPLPAAGAIVKLGRAVLTADAEGAFTLTGLPAGAMTLTASAPTLASAALDLTLAAGEAKTLPLPLVLFPETGIAGLLYLLPPTDLGLLIASGHPYLRSFQVITSKTARVMRVHHDPAALINPELAPWRPVTSLVDYDFPRDGGQNLYFQFADDARTLLSDVFSINVILDQFAGTKGFIIEDGSGRVNRRDVILSIDVPPAAHRMRIAEATSELELKPWLPVAPVYPYMMELGRNEIGLPVGYGHRTIFLQFTDALGFVSPVYKQTVTLEMFPSPPTPVFTLDGGAALTTNRLVRLDIQIPPNANEMRVFESGTGSGGGFGGSGGNAYNPQDLWLQVRSYMFFTFHSPGLKTVNLQFKSLDGSISPVYQQIIRVDPFPDYAVGFEINGGAPSSSSRYLDIELVPPVAAVAFRIFEDSGSGSGGGGGFGSSLQPWITITPHFAYEARGTGQRTIYVQYLTLDGDESFAFHRSIFVDPFPPGSGDLVINGGASVALLPTLALDILPPVDAIAMAVREGVPPSDFDPQWLELAQAMNLTVFSTGPKTIYIKFKAADGTISPAIQRTIFYEPFPFASAGVEIASGAATTSNPEVTLTFFGLPNLLKLRYAESLLELEVLPFQEFVTTATHVFVGPPGPRKVYVQYATVTGELSPVYMDEITLVP